MCQDAEKPSRDGPGPGQGDQRPASLDDCPGETEPQSEELEGGAPFGSYRLLRRIGAGGMGQVWKAEEDYPRRIVALKFVKPQLFAHQSAAERTRTIRRFRSEIETAAQLEHPNIVPLYHAGEEGGRLYYTMQYVDGRSPLHILRGYQPTVAGDDTPDDQPDTWRDHAEDRPSSTAQTGAAGARQMVDAEREQWRRAAKYIVQASRGLAYAHNRGFIHRDIKPDNIIIDRLTDTARVTDFGLAKALQESADLEIPPDYRAGTRGFMAPEQESSAGTATVQSDIYGLGATLVALLAGAPPKRPGESGDEFRDISPTPADRVPLDLQAICLKCLQRAADARYSSASDLADDLERFLDLRPVVARPIGRMERMRYWARRSPRLATVGLIALLLGLAVVVGGPVSAYLYLSAVHTAEIERQNKRFEAMEKRRAQEDSRRTRANLIYQKAQTARERGDWRAAIDYLHKAQEAGYPDRVMLAVDRARAQRSLGQIAGWIGTVNGLAKDTNSDAHRGTILLLEGDVARFQGQAEKSTELTQKALDAGLSLVEEPYARAILAQTTPECLDFLRQAVARDPYHYDATMMLVAALVLSGHRDEARQRAQLGETIFPDDSGFALWMAVLAAAESDPEEMKRQMDKVGDRLDTETKSLVFKALQNLRAFCDNFNHMDLGKNNDLKVLWNLASLALTFRRVYGQAGEQHTSLLSATRSLPQAYRRAYAPLFELMPASVIGLLGIGTQAYADRLAEAAKRHPEGTLFLMRGGLLSEANQYAEAERAFAAAADAPAIIPGVNREAPMLAAAAANLLYAESGGDPACLKRAVGYVRRRVRSGASPPFQSDLMLHIANSAGDDGLARTIIWQVLDQYDEDVEWLLLVAKNELNHDKFERALDVLDQAGALEPDNSEVNSLRARAIRLKSENARK